ncbi:MAG: ATPase, partial [Boseongicola sp.]
MNMQTSNVIAPPAPRSLEGMKLPIVMMRDILLKTMFRMNLDAVTDLATAMCLPVPVTQELVDMAREQKLVEATGTLHANSGGEMGFQLTEAGKSRALDALAQSEYYGAMPVPLEIYSEQVKRQSIRNIQVTRDQLIGAMEGLILPDELLDHLGPAVSAGRSILMYGPPGNGKSSISNGIRDALGDKIYIPRAIEYSGQVITVYDPIVHTAAETIVDDPNSLR